MEATTRTFPRSSAFEMLLGRVYIELWELQENPSLYASRICRFVTIWLPTMYQKKLIEKLPGFEARIAALDERTANIRKNALGTDAFTEDFAKSVAMPVEEAEFADEVWHATMDVLTEAGFNFPISKEKGYRTGLG